VLRYFDGFEQAVWMKRYRCAECGAVHTARPHTHWRGFWASWKIILVSLLSKLKRERWLKGPSRQRQQYWWKGFEKQVGRDKNPQSNCTPAELRRLLQQTLIVSTHSLKYCEITLSRDRTNLIFAATEGVGFG